MQAQVERETRACVRELLGISKPHMNPIRLLVIGCSTSEITGGSIGQASVPALGATVARSVLDEAASAHVDVAFQCCEHLNRALVMEREAARHYGFEEVWAVPYPKAGGSCASAAYRMMKDPVLVERVQADAALDIGLTLIGMHLRRVAVPVRLHQTHIGAATVTAAITRPPLVGGERARYELDE